MAGAAMPRSLPRVILHAGFHKTGTSSAQAMLDAARSPLAPVARAVIKSDMAALVSAALSHAADPTPASLSTVAKEAEALFQRINPDDTRTLLISSEDLSGRIPGRKDRTGYPEAPALLTALAHGMNQAWGALPDLTLYYSTRTPETWVRSCHDHHLRVARLKQDFDSYAQAQRAHADLPAMASQIAEALPEARLVTHALEDMAALPHGPLTPLLDLAKIPEALRQDIPLLPPANTSLSALSPTFLALNRSDLDRPAVKAAKKALIRKARRD